MNKNLFFFYSCCFQRTTPSSPTWTLDFEPAFSPRFLPTLSLRSIFPTGQRFLPTLSPRSLFPLVSGFLPTLSPRSFFPTGQRFPLSNHVTSGSHEPAILFIHWSAVSHTGNDMTSSICSRPIRSQSEYQTSPLYYYYYIVIYIFVRINNKTVSEVLSTDHSQD